MTYDLTAADTGTGSERPSVHPNLSATMLGGLCVLPGPGPLDFMPTLAGLLQTNPPSGGGGGGGSLSQLSSGQDLKIGPWLWMQSQAEVVREARFFGLDDMTKGLNPEPSINLKT